MYLDENNPTLAVQGKAKPELKVLDFISQNAVGRMIRSKQLTEWQVIDMFVRSVSPKLTGPQAAIRALLMVDCVPCLWVASSFRQVA